jgi:eukaryotic-like serine/threonine-protein kinase
MTLSAGIRLGPYEVVGPLGKGGMGEVYRGRDTRLDREVAIKVLPDRLAKDSEALARFEREAKILAALSHPNVLAIHDVGKENGVAFTVMELLEGETLRGRLSRSRPPWREAMEIAVAVAEGLAAAHSRGVFHRDLKPENVFLVSDGRVKILDFGLARRDPASLPIDRSRLPTATQHTEPGTVMGTVGYMSPEQVSGGPGDARSDIFSLGCVLYEMAMGLRAFSGTTGAETMAAILRDPPPENATRRHEIPPDLSRVISHCLEKRPEQRFQSARDLAFDLKAILAGTGVGSSLPVPHARRSLAPWLLASGIAVLAIVAAFNLTRRPSELVSDASTIRSLAVLPLENVSKDPEQDYFVDGMTDELITDLSKISGLRVISRSSVMRYKATKKPIREIARELGVGYLVGGRVLRSGDRVRITAELIQVRPEKNVWAESYERDVKDVLKIQGEAAKAIAGEIRIHLRPEEARHLDSAPEVNAQAFQNYLRGRYYWWKNTPAEYEKSLEFYRRSIEEDPAYAAPYSGMSDAYLSMVFSGILPPKGNIEKAEAAASKAIALDPSLPEAHFSLASAKYAFNWNFAAAEPEFRKSLELSPRNPFVLRFYGAFLRSMGRFGEAIQLYRQAQECDPLSAETTKALGAAYFWAGQYDRAIAEYKKALALDPEFQALHDYLADAYTRKKMYREAVAEWQKEFAMLGDQASADAVGRSFESVGFQKTRDTLLRSKLESLQAQMRDGYVPPSFLAAVYAELNEKDEAFRWLEKAYDERHPSLAYLKTDPEFENLRSDPRFRDMVRRVGIPG